MLGNVCFLGFGEAARTFCADPRWRARARGYDIKIDAAEWRAAKLEDFSALRVTACDSAAAAVSGADIVLSLVTADQALAAASAVAEHIAPGALFLDMNSVAPSTKQTAAQRLQPRGARYVDVAIMAPVHPAALATVLLTSGPHAAPANDALRALGFANLRAVGDAVGRASRIKMVRSVLVKGVEAVTAECLIAAHAGGVLEDVLDSLAETWREQANYNLERMLVHGVRRAAEMEEVAQTLLDLGVEPTMTRGAIQRQRALGELGLSPAPVALDEKLARIKGAQAV